MPAVDFRLQGIAHREQVAVFRGQIADDGGKPGPERVGRNPGLGGGFLGDEIEQDGRDLQAVGIDTIHGQTLAKSGCYAPLSGVKTNSAARAAFKAPFSAKAVALRRPFAGLRLRKQWPRGPAQMLAARSTGSSNRMPDRISICSISSVASGTERAEVSIVNSLAVGGW